MKSPTVFSFALILAGWLPAVATAAASEQLPLLPNPDFTQGDDAPTGWTLSGGQGRWVDRGVLEVSSPGSGSNHWRADCRFEPGKLYRFTMRARGTTGRGCVTSGPEFANCDHRVTDEWRDYGQVFRVPDDVEDSYVRLGQWETKGTVEFDRVRLVPVLPAHLQAGDLTLGEGEMIRDGLYTFTGRFSWEGGNYHRPLDSATARFNSNRWCFGTGDQVTYRFELPGHKLTGGELSFNVCWHTRGACTAQVSADGKTWHALATQDAVGAAQAELPQSLLPAASLLVRLQAAADTASFQVDRIGLSGRLDGAPCHAVGETLFAEIQEAEPQIGFESLALKRTTGGVPILQVRLRNNGRQAVCIDDIQVRAAPDAYEMEHLAAGTDIRPGKSVAEEFALLGAPGQNRLQIEFRGAARKLGANGEMETVPLDRAAALAVTFNTPEYYRIDYGELLDTPGDGAVWWCPATHKIPPHHFPMGSGRQASFSAARNDREAVQIVVRPKEDLHGLAAQAGPLAGPGGAAIPAEAIRVLRVAYHFVEHPTDRTGVRDFWPDALPPLDRPIDVPAGQNQPLWVLVHVPKDAKAGDYQGTVSLKAEGFSAEVPVKLHVWDFALPDRNHLETAFGLKPEMINRYHQLKTEDDKRRVWDMYLRAFSEHRLSPYDPVPMDPIRVQLKPEADPPAAEVDFSAFDPAFARALDEYHFNTYRLPIRGMGGGTFHARHEPSIDGYGADTPEYQAVFSSYVGQLESHFREKGWLDIPYIYWFDEPAPKDYEFVRSGFERLKRSAPGLRRMLTEQPEEELAGPVDIWCPVSHHYDQDASEACRARGERFWWYVCCGPKAPYCTLFIDHPATELRVWLWQTWQRRIGGILVWTSNYWTSSAAYPDGAQNPYEDPMGWRSGYSTPKGEKRPWGNGDGRFLYPPEAAAMPGLAGPDPVVAPPASSIRLEMLREGIEDWEYLYLLRELIKKCKAAGTQQDLAPYEALLEVPESITRDMTTFTTDPKPIYARRKQIAEAIERLSR